MAFLRLLSLEGHFRFSFGTGQFFTGHKTDLPFFRQGFYLIFAPEGRGVIALGFLEDQRDRPVGGGVFGALAAVVALNALFNVFGDTGVIGPVRAFGDIKRPFFFQLNAFYFICNTKTHVIKIELFLVVFIIKRVDSVLDFYFWENIKTTIRKIKNQQQKNSSIFLPVFFKKINQQINYKQIINQFNQCNQYPLSRKPRFFTQIHLKINFKIYKNLKK